MSSYELRGNMSVLHWYKLVYDCSEQRFLCQVCASVCDEMGIYHESSLAVFPHKIWDDIAALASKLMHTNTRKLLAKPTELHESPETVVVTLPWLPIHAIGVR